MASFLLDDSSFRHFVGCIGQIRQYTPSSGQKFCPGTFEVSWAILEYKSVATDTCPKVTSLGDDDSRMPQALGLDKSQHLIEVSLPPKAKFWRVG